MGQLELVDTAAALWGGQLGVVLIVAFPFHGVARLLLLQVLVCRTNTLPQNSFSLSAAAVRCGC